MRRVSKSQGEKGDKWVFSMNGVWCPTWFMGE